MAPLLAVAEELRKLEPHAEFLFVGTKKGPERKMAEAAGIRFEAIPAAKFRRYFSFSNFTDIFVFLGSIIAARKLVRRFKPDVVFSAGGFVAVPVSWVGNMAGAKIVIHQQDARVGLSNRLISPMADVITTAFERTAKDFYSGSGVTGKLKPTAEWVGNPVRRDFFTPASPDAKKKFGLSSELPVLLVVGGATGAAQINEVVEDCVGELVKTHQVIHVTGMGKSIEFKHPNYHQYEFLNHDYPDAMKLADIVISRAGLSSIAELSALGKISIIVPMPGTHQEDNAEILSSRHAAVVLSKEEFTPEDLPRIVTSLKFNVGRQKSLQEKMAGIIPHDAAARIAKLIHDHA